MKKLFLFAIALLLQELVNAQPAAKIKEPGYVQVGVFGGISQPLGMYRGETGRAQTGPAGGLFADKYFRGNRWGIGIDARFMQHNIRKFDSVFFANGNIAPTYNRRTAFRHFGIALGPSYKQGMGRMELEAFVRGGILFQQFPEYYQTITYNFAVPPPGSAVIYRTANASNSARSWMGMAGIRINYLLSDKLGLFLQADYLRGFGTRFGADSSEFYIQYNELLKPIGPADIVDDPYNHYSEIPVVKKTHTEAVNLSLGIKYTIGKKRSAPVYKPVIAKEETLSPAVKKEPDAPAKDILVVVKDRQTGLALSGVRVDIVQGGQTYTSVTNANGEAERITAANPEEYAAHGEKNGVATSTAFIHKSDFRQSGSLIYKEIYHDDPRFTLVGETVDCESNNKLSAINTMLTHTVSRVSQGQLSDAEGKFIYQLEQGAAYTIVANQAGKYSQTENISTSGLDRSKTLYVTLKLGVCNLQAGASWVLKNILYDLDKSYIRPDAAIVLDNVVNIMKQNPSLKIELSSHTDSRGSDAYNLALSQRRASAAVSYLVSKGVEKSRLTAKGYGETKLLNECANKIDCSEEQHQQNRRTEIKIISY